MRLAVIAKLAAALAFAMPVLAPAQEVRPSLQDSFRLGSGSGLLCRVQSRLTDEALATMFDRSYAIVCRDAAAAVGQVYALRDEGRDPAGRLAAARTERANCSEETRDEIADLGTVTETRCTLRTEPVGYTVYSWRSGGTLYVAEGLSGYDSALRLALRSIVADRILPGELSIATTEMGDAAAFARVQAGTLDIDQALSEAYRRNNSGNYAEAAEFFETLLGRIEENDEDANERAGEYLINRALQQSNLGDFEAADATYAQALAIPSASPTQLRLRRNFRALHFLNQRRFDEALAVLDEGLAGSLSPRDAPDAAVITRDMSAEVNSGSELARRLGGEESERLTVAERAVILDAQAEQLRGAILRVKNQAAEARAALERSLAQIVSVRDGRVRSTARLRAQALSELALLDEEAGDFASAETRFSGAVALVDMQYPRSVAASAARSRLAAFLARRGRTAEALAMFAEVIEANRDQAATRTALENRLAPYFELLLREMPGDPSLVGDFFLATETLVRPGVANTQAVLARELGGGNDEAARLFRQSVTLTRAIESARVEIARLRAVENPDGDVLQRRADAEEELAGLIGEQTVTMSALSRYPRYQAVSTAALTLADLQAALGPGEAYLKLSEVAGRIYAVFATSDGATAYRAAIDADVLVDRVAMLRETISTVENGVRLTYPFDVRLARQLFVELMGPVAPQLAGVEHLVFEPDGAMTQLPAALLVTDEAGVVAYERRLDTVGNDPFDYTGVAWLGRRTDVSTAVSARNFRELRDLPRSAAGREYLGLGENAPPRPQVRMASLRQTDGLVDPDCVWPIEAWGAPISARELETARRIVGADASALVTGAAFSDTAVMNREDLENYRIVHFATHGLVTQPHPHCPPQPALLTSFGDSADSDGLLSFAEIFDLRLDADLVILSACDTASAAGLAASSEAGVKGGASALDGLVRAFVGAGSRAVIASHWPAPDDFSATERLIVGLFEAQPGTPLAGAMRSAQTALMNDPATSHPYYWAGFAIVGDAVQPVVRSN